MNKEIESIISMWGIEDKNIIQIYSSAWEVNDEYIIKVYDNKTQIERNIEMLSVLSEHGIPVAEIIPAQEGKKYVEAGNQYYFMSRKLKGNNLSDVRDLKLAYRMGQVIGQLHLAFEKCEEKINFWNNSLLDEMKGWIHECLEKDGWRLVKESEYDDAVSELERVYDFLPKQLIHRDVHFGNFLFLDGEFTGYIDFDLSQRNIRIFDLCYFLAGLLSEEEGKCLCEGEWFKILKEVLRGYDSINKLAPTEKEAIPCVMECIEILFAAYFISIDDLECANNAVDIYHFILKNEENISPIDEKLWSFGRSR